tara:strand:+ start:359 stop:607 length:249 start_codon:yes stop_codon:yes gene_type:complete
VAKKSKEKPFEITLPDGSKHVVEELSEENQMLSHHLADLQNKTNNLKWSLDQMMMGVEFAQAKLIENLKKEEEEGDGQPKDE